MKEMTIPVIKNLRGVSQWRIFQQNDKGNADIPIKGRLVLPVDDVDAWGECRLCVRMVFDASYRPVTSNTTWKPVDSHKVETGAFSHVFKKIPAGGLYRIEFGLAIGDVHQPNRFLDSVDSIGVGDLWVIAGQSNAAGIGTGMCDDGPELGVHILRNDETWALATHPLNSPARSTHPNIEGRPCHSPFLAFGKILKKERGYPIGLIQTSLGGSPMSRWNPDEQGDLYQNMLNCVSLAGGRVTGVVWYQGCSDCLSDLAATYYERFKNFVETARIHIGHEHLPFITTQLNRVAMAVKNKTQDRCWSVLREAQRRAAREIPYVAIVPALGLPLGDCIHNSVAGNLELAARYATTALGFVYNHNIPWNYPTVSSIHVLDEKKLCLEFENVTSALNCIAGAPNDFLVKDSRGEISIKSFSVPQPNQIHLELSRHPIKGATVSAGFGANPIISFYDYQENRPILAFTDFPVEIW